MKVTCGTPGPTGPTADLPYLPYLPYNPLMRIAIGADHAGFEMKRDLSGYLAQAGHEVTDLGTHTTAAC